MHFPHVVVAADGIVKSGLPVVESVHCTFLRGQLQLAHVVITDTGTLGRLVGAHYRRVAEVDLGALSFVARRNWFHRASRMLVLNLLLRALVAQPNLRLYSTRGLLLLLLIGGA